MRKRGKQHLEKQKTRREMFRQAEEGKEGKEGPLEKGTAWALGSDMDRRGQEKATCRGVRRISLNRENRQDYCRSEKQG